MSFTSYYPGYGFFGTLNQFATDSMYGVQLANSQSFLYRGVAETIPKTITLNGLGWTYLPCPYQEQKALAVGMPTGVSFSLEDQVKSQFQFASFYPGYGWFGTLAAIVPGSGYMLKLQAQGGVATFV